MSLKYDNSILYTHIFMYMYSHFCIYKYLTIASLRVCLLKFVICLLKLVTY